MNQDEIRKMINEEKFIAVNELIDGSEVPQGPGIYCISLRKGVTLPKEFGELQQNRVIYIGQASRSLRDRLWEQELNHKQPATFFRSIGAVLGYLPPKGSLCGKKNTKNYKFSPEDTRKIISWMRDSLRVCFVEDHINNLKEEELSLIKEFKPLLNIQNNPVENKALKEARKKCKDWANMKS